MTGNKTPDTEKKMSPLQLRKHVIRQNFFAYLIFAVLAFILGGVHYFVNADPQSAGTWLIVASVAFFLIARNRSINLKIEDQIAATEGPQEESK